MVLFGRDAVVVEVDKQFEELMIADFTFQDNLYTSTAGGSLAHWLASMLLFKEGDHLSLGWLTQCDDTEVDITPSEVRANNLTSLHNSNQSNELDERTVWLDGN